MKIGEAIEIINSDLVFRPDWKITARPSYGNKIEITYVIDTVDTNYPPDYLAPKTIGDEFEIDVSGLDEDGLLLVLLRRFAGTHEHEDREFLRRRSEGLNATFHPHHIDGEMRWLMAQLGSMEHVA
jgi:hypothetical protein